MKKLSLYIAIIFFFVSFLGETKADFRNNSYNHFYSSLRPYGEWIELDFGLLVWRPTSVHAYWKPYSIGRWSWTRHGWYWDSYEPFGWATYHYGRWHYDDYYGWIWIPDNEWGPSWVEWRYDDDYIGWAPLPPYAQFKIGFGIHFSLSWHSHFSYWNFVTFHRFHSHRLHYYLVDQSRSYRIFSRTKYRNNYYNEDDRIINGGVDKSYIERRGGYRISERDINDVTDFEKYERTRNSGSERIYNYRPSEREMESNRSNANIDIKKSDRRSSLEADRIVVNDRNFKSREISSERSITRNSDNNDRQLPNERSEKREVMRNEPDRNTRSGEKRNEVERSHEIDKRKIENRSERNNDSDIRIEKNDRGLFERKSVPEKRPEIERRSESDRRVESRRESNSERPSQRRENSESRSESKSREKDSRNSSERRR